MPADVSTGETMLVHFRSPRAAWVAWAVTVALWAMMMGFIALPRPVPSEGLFVLPRVAGSLLVLSTATVGALLASRRPKNPIAWIFCAAALGWDSGAFATEYALYALVEDPGSLPAGELVAWLSAWLLATSGLAIIFVLLLFPDGRLPSRCWRPVGWAAVVGTLVWTLGIAFTPGPLDTSILSVPQNPFGVEGVPWVRTVEAFGVYVTLACALLAAISLIARLRHSRGVERQQLKWFAFGAVYVVGVEAGLWLAILSFGLTLSSPIGHVLVAAGVLALLLVPVTTGIAILRYRLYDIDIIINRTLVYGTVTALLAGLFAALSILTQRIVLAVTGQESQAAVVLAALVVTALFQPLRARVQTVVDHRFYRRKYDATRTLEQFAGWIRDEVELDRLTAGLVTVVRKTMQPTHASLRLRSPVPSQQGQTVTHERARR
jgi:hypothetical protein